MENRPSRGEGDPSHGDGLDLHAHLGGSSRELLHRLLDGDPLGLEKRSAERRDQLAYLVASERMYYRSAAQIAFNACRYGVKGPLDPWITTAIDRGLRGILRDEEDEHRAGAPIDPDEEGYYHAITDLLDVSLEQARAICIAFNGLRFEARQAYFEYTKLRAERDDGASVGSLREDLARALIALLTVGGALE